MNLERISSVLQGYTGQEESMHAVVQVLEEELGEEWVQTVFQDLQTLSPALKENLTHAYNYYAATMAWNETQEYLMNPNLQQTPQVVERLPILKHWLDFFGAAGQSAYQELEGRLGAAASFVEPAVAEVPVDAETAVLTAEPVVVQTADEAIPVAEQVIQNPVENTPIYQSEEALAAEEKITADALPQFRKAELKEQTPEEFELEKIQNQLNLLEQNQAWLAARCIQLKGIEIYAYPFYGFVVDLMRQVLKNMNAVLANEETALSIDKYFAGGRAAFDNKKQAVESDIEKAEQNCESATTALISEDIDMDEVRRTLGTIDTRDTVEYVGPAPDGFELLDDAPLDETTIKKQYEKIENIDALTGEKAPQSENVAATQENASQNAQKGVQQRKLSFSLKRPKPTEDAT